MRFQIKKQHLFIFSIIYIICAGLLISTLIHAITSRHIRQAEDALTETAALIATLLQPQLGDGIFGGAYIRDTLENQLLYIHGPGADHSDTGKRIDLRIAIIDRQGYLIYDSWNLPIGENFSQKQDVMRALHGQQGTSVQEENTGNIQGTFLYASVPLQGKSAIVGALVLGKPLRAYDRYSAGINIRIIMLTATAAFAAAVLVLLLCYAPRRSDLVNHAHSRVHIPVRTDDSTRQSSLSAADVATIHPEEETGNSETPVPRSPQEIYDDHIDPPGEEKNESGLAEAPSICCGPFDHTPLRMQIKYYDTALELSRYEYKLLALLIEHPAQVFTRDELLDKVWGQDSENLDRTVDAHIKTLRAKLKAIAPDIQAIRTVRGFGYALNDEWPENIC